MQLNIYQYFQLLSLLIAIMCYKGLRRDAIQAFVPMLILTNVIEILGINFRYFGWTQNYFIYNFNLLLVTPFQLFLFGKMLQLKNNERPVFAAVGFLAMLIILLNYLFLQGRYQFNTFSLVLIEVLTVVFSCFVLLRRCIFAGVDVNLLKTPVFWINAATLSFALVALVMLGLQPYIHEKGLGLFNRSLYYAVMPVINIILYSAYCYAFVLCTTNNPR